MSAASPSPSRHNIPEETDPPDLSKAQKKRRRLYRRRARAKLRQEEQSMHAKAPEDEQSPSVVSSEASSEAELEVANDYYRHIVAPRSTENEVECVPQTCPPAQDEELLVDPREVELGECASSRMGVPGQNQSPTAVSEIVLSIPESGKQEDAAPKLSKSQKKRRRQGKKRRAMALAKLGQQEQPQCGSSALDTLEG